MNTVQLPLNFNRRSLEDGQSPKADSIRSDSIREAASYAFFFVLIAASFVF